MKTALRWSLLLPAVSLAVLVSWSLIPLGRNAALLACPSALRTTEATTDFSQPDFAAISQTCLASWFPATEALLFVGGILLSVLAAGVVGYNLPPSRKWLSAALSSMLAIGAVVAAFAYGA